MANPQCENGYTKIANQIMEALINHKLSGQELRTILFIIRKTYGFNKKEDYISLSQIGKVISAGKTRCSQIMTRLQLLKILTVTENINGKTKKYLFNKDFEQWLTVNGNIYGKGKVKPTVKVFSNRPLRKTLTTKETNIKEYTDNFLMVWKEYPNKKSKSEAFKAWRKINPNKELIDIILSFIAKAKTSREWTDDYGKYIPMLATFLNNARWEDELNFKIDKEVKLADKYPNL